MRIETPRLLLRPYREEDLQDQYEFLSDEEVVRFEPHLPMDISDVRENLVWRILTDEMIAIEHKESGKMIGNVYFGRRDFNSFELGYVFNRHFWKRGCATEACGAVIESAFSNGAHRIYAECDPENTPSWRLLERLGFQREATLRKNIYFWKDSLGEPIWKDTYVYALLEGEHFQKGV